MKNNLLQILKPFELLFFPKTCLVCGKNENYICDACLGEVSYVLNYSCLVCQKPSLDGFIHLKCKNKFTPDRFLSAFEYKGVVKKALIGAKYRGKIFDTYNLLVGLAFEHFEEMDLNIGNKAIVIPIPVHFKKYIKRTFNHADIIAGIFAKNYGIKVVNALKKVKETQTQSLLKREERKKNVESVFKVNSRYLNDIKGKDIVLIDDIVTTGSTMLSACKALRKLGNNGPRYIYCLSLAYDLPYIRFG